MLRSSMSRSSRAVCLEATASRGVAQSRHSAAEHAGVRVGECNPARRGQLFSKERGLSRDSLRLRSTEACLEAGEKRKGQGSQDRRRGAGGVRGRKADGGVWAPLVVGRCEQANPNQTWSWTSLGSDFFLFHSGTGLCLQNAHGLAHEAANASTPPATRLAPCRIHESLLWTKVSQGEWELLLGLLAKTRRGAWHAPCDGCRCLGSP